MSYIISVPTLPSNSSKVPHTPSQVHDLIFYNCYFPSPPHMAHRIHLVLLLLLVFRTNHLDVITNWELVPREYFVFLGIHWLHAALHLGVGPCEISSVVLVCQRMLTPFQTWKTVAFNPWSLPNESSSIGGSNFMFLPQLPYSLRIYCHTVPTT